MTDKQFTTNGKEIIQNKQVWCMAYSEHCADVIATAMNELREETEKEKDKYHQLFEKYWDLKRKLNKISDIINRYDKREMEEE